MLSHIVQFSLKFKALVLGLAGVLVIGGLLVVAHSPLDVFPEFVPPMVEIHTEAPGLTAENVEKLVTIPIENTINGSAGLRTMRSSSIPGISVVRVIFEEGFDIFRARQMLNERLSAEAGHRPAGVKPPSLLPLASVSSQVLMVGLSSPSRSLMDLRTLAQWTLRPRLLAVPGVSSVTIYGGEEKQIQVIVSPQKLKAYQLSFQDVIRAAGNASAIGGAGYLDLPNQRLSIQQEGAIADLHDLAMTPVALKGGKPIFLGQVADMKAGPAIKVGDAAINGKAGVLLIIGKQPFVNTLVVTKKVDQVLRDLKAALPGDVTLYPALFRQADFINEAISDLKGAILIGCALVMIVLVLFLYEWRTAAISLVAIPLSLLGAIVVVRFFGGTLNTMTLGGLAIALGEVVDDAIIDVENIFRRLALNRQAAYPRPALDVVFSASLEVRSAVVYASFIVSLVFLPVFFLGGISGAIFSPIGTTYILAIMVSLVMALTVTPVLSLIMLPSIARSEDKAPLVHWLSGHYSKGLTFALEHGRGVLAGALIFLVTAVCGLPFLGGEFLPDFKEPNFVIHMVGLPGTSLEESLRIGQKAGAKLVTIPGIKSIIQHVGRAELSEDTMGSNYSELWLALDTKICSYEAIFNDVQKEVRNIPGFVFNIKQFLKERLDEVISGATAPIVVKIYGPDLSTLHTLAEKVSRVVSGVRGVSGLAVEPQVLEPQVQIRVRRASAALYGLTPAELEDEVSTALEGKTVGQVYEDQRVVDVVVRAPEEVRHDLNQVRRFLIDTPSGARIPLGTLAEIRLAGAPNVINREDASRRILVTCGVKGRDVAGTMKEIQTRLAQEMSFPPGTHVEFSGEYEAQREGQVRIFYLGALSLVGIFCLLYIDFRSFRLCSLMMLSVPFALVGGVVAVVLSGGDVSLGSLVGFVTLFGISIRNGIMLISHYRHLQAEENVPFGRALIMKGAQERLSPILMTALSAGIALLPLVIGGGRPGHEIVHPMAVVIVGGLVSSTLLNLFVLPVLFEIFGSH